MFKDPAACSLPLYTTMSVLCEVIGCWFGKLTSRLGGLACLEFHLPACQPGRCTSPSSLGRWLCPQSGSEGSTPAPRPPEASAHLQQSTPQCSWVHCLTCFFCQQCRCFVYVLVLLQDHKQGYLRLCNCQRLSTLSSC